MLSKGKILDDYVNTPLLPFNKWNYVLEHIIRIKLTIKPVFSRSKYWNIPRTTPTNIFRSTKKN